MTAEQDWALRQQKHEGTKQMEKESMIRALFRDVVNQDGAGMKRFFAEQAVIRWHNTNEQFTVSEYIRANCEYPGTWQGEIERLEVNGSTAVSAARVWSGDGDVSFHVVSFYTWEDDGIVSLDEYWGDDGPAPGWRQELKLGKRIHED